jgi:allophanate hydrolase subunit 1
METDPTPYESPLSQYISRDGLTVRVDIYEDGDGGWILEVVDSYNNSTVWNDPFPTDEQALAEVLRTIEEDGITSLVGERSQGSTH